ncbi:hypothetical protein BST14_13760 [Mycobacterium arosiense ATCC BAA-1401 = DSM 45069]|uniref:Uncharacterized protein n=3 Tax=Mycobacterium TaxID=1763 RepID=A0A1W9ZG23_MYCAI|nr:hypothetical protein BST14_13760 [Mycobacterium arosiense ATCC BAA-1401 = DSM 45069]ORJ52527.1 hypothetical protein B5M45_31180 [Mycobacterium simiae]RAV08839.1 hypothetical protein DQP57_16125 [Mycobacterium colombiense]
MVSEPLHSSRQAPKLPPARIQDLTMLVRVPGRPEAIRAFTDAEHALAEHYASQEGGVITTLGSD